MSPCRARSLASLGLSERLDFASGLMKRFREAAESRITAACVGLPLTAAKKPAGR